MELGKIKGLLYCFYDTEQKNPVASAILSEDNEIKAVWVDNNYRNQGLGKKLVNSILKDMEVNNLSKEKPESERTEIIYHCHPNNLSSNKLAESCGFKLWHRWYKNG